MRINKFEQDRKEAKSRTGKYLIRTLQMLFVVVVALVLSLQHQRIKSCEDDIKDIQKLQYLQWEIKKYEDLKSKSPPPLQDKVLLAIPKFTPPPPPKCIKFDISDVNNH